MACASRAGGLVRAARLLHRPASGSRRLGRRRLDDLEDNPDDEDYLLTALADGQDAAAGHADEAEASEPTAETARDQAAEQTLDAAGAGGMRIYDPHQEAQAW
ncbi:hypothetical protein [Streptomyces asiaticus]